MLLQCRITAGIKGDAAHNNMNMRTNTNIINKEIFFSLFKQIIGKLRVANK